MMPPAIQALSASAQGMLIVGGLIGLIVLVATIAAAVLHRMGRGPADLMPRVRSWWVIVAVLGLILVTPPAAGVTIIGFVSYMAFKEYLTITPSRRSDRLVMLLAYLLIPAQYYWIHAGSYGFFIIWVPVYGLIVLATGMVLVGRTENFLRAVSSLHWGLMITVFAIGHAAFLLVLPQHAAAGGVTAGAGPLDGPALLLLLFALTQANDIAQYLIGKSVGRRKVVPTVSPGKTWEGLAGGVLVTALVSAVIAPMLSPAGPASALAIGLAVAIGGFLGDVTMSAVKRDLGIKDISNLLPGHGGLLDRLDSTVFTAPILFHTLRYFHFS